MNDRHTADSITSDALDQLYAQLARAERAVRRAEGSESWMAKHLARQDSRVNGLTRDRDRQRDRADRTEAALTRVRKATANSFMAGPNAVDVVRVADIHAALDRAADTVPDIPADKNRHTIPNTQVNDGEVADNQTDTAEAVRQMDADTTEPHTGLVVQPYTVHGERKWVFRCWGTDTCDGWLSLDHYNEQSATRARDRHVTEEHPSEEQPMPPTCTATIEGPHVLGGGPVQCTREAGHPENHVGPKRGDAGRTLWSDHNAGATPHRTSSEEQR